MTTKPTPIQASLARLQARREGVARADAALATANRDLGPAVAAHLAALVRETFPTAVALVIRFPRARSRGHWFPTLDSVLGPAPSPLATNPTLYDNTVEDGAFKDGTPALDDPWLDAIETIEDLTEEYATITGTHTWPWCDTDGHLRILNFPPNPEEAEAEKRG